MNLPTDPEIPALEALRQTGPDVLMKKAGLQGSFEVERLLRHHPGRRCTLALRDGQTTVVFKAYRDGRSVEGLLGVMAGLEDAGLGEEGGPAPAGILGFDTQKKFIVTEWFDGPSGRDLIEAGQGRRAGELAATWVKGSRIDLRHFPFVDRPQPAAESALQMTKAMTGNPLLSGRAGDLLEALSLDAPPAGSESLCHGSCKPGHIFDLGGRPGLIDWESARAGPAELDAGTFLGKLASLRIRHPRLAGELSQARRAFLDLTGELLNLRWVVWYEAFAQLKRASVASQRRGRKAEQKSGRLLDEAMNLLASAP